MPSKQVYNPYGTVFFEIMNNTKLSKSKNKNEMDKMEAAVWGPMSIGIGHSQCEELFALLDIPFMAPKTYTTLTLNVKKIWEDYVFSEIKKNGEVEKRIAIENGMVNADGTPYICDGDGAKDLMDTVIILLLGWP